MNWTLFIGIVIGVAIVASIYRKRRYRELTLEEKKEALAFRRRLESGQIDLRDEQGKPVKVNGRWKKEAWE